MDLKPEETLVLKSQNLSFFEDLKKGKKSISVIKGTITTNCTVGMLQPEFRHLPLQPLFSLSLCVVCLQHSFLAAAGFSVLQQHLFDFFSQAKAFADDSKKLNTKKKKIRLAIVELKNKYRAICF